MAKEGQMTREQEKSILENLKDEDEEKERALE